MYVGETRYTASGSVSLYMRYILDEGNSPVGISLWYPGDTAWTDYHFVKNLQGDVLKVYKVSDGSLAASYSYDSWGNILSKSGSLASINPFRYRSYYFDEQTWFYYLQSRYYDPAIGRFLNADVFASTGQGVLGYNVFAYCLNNPVNGCDPCGTCFHRWDFWNDCKDCGGATFSQKIYNNVQKTKNFLVLQEEIQNSITEQQTQIIRNAGKRMLERNAYHAQTQIDSQYQRDMTVIAMGKYYTDNPKKAVDHAFMIIGVSGLYCSYVASAGVTIPTALAATIKITETIGTLWGAYRMLEEINQDVFRGK